MGVGAYQKELFARRCDDLVSSAVLLLGSLAMPPELQTKLAQLRDLAASAAEQFRQVPRPEELK